MGEPGEARKPSMMLWSLLAASALVAVIALVVALVILPDAKTEATADRAGETAAVAEAKAAIEQRLPDATDMSFGKTRVSWIGEVPAVCGEVDVDEPQDSFEGPEQFIYFQGQLLIEQIDGSDQVDGRWKDLCESV